MLLKKVVLQAGVRLVVIRVGDCIEAHGRTTRPRYLAKTAAA
jgi:hypothetical protein